MHVVGVSDGCTLRGVPTACTYAVNGTALTFDLTIRVCSSSGVQSAGCGSAQADCTGPVLAPGTYAIPATKASLVVDASGSCQLE